MKKALLKKVLPFSLVVAMSVNLSAFSNVARAEEANGEGDGYSLVWSEEFDGDALNTDDWNVEEHEPGWVNAELQRYTALDEGNIEVSDGVLKIKPHVTGGEASDEGQNAQQVDLQDLESKEISFDITVPADHATTTAAIQINFGKIDDTENGNAAATLIISEPSLKDVTEGEDNELELMKSPAFDNTADWAFGSTAPGEGTVEYKDGYAQVTVKSAGDANWNVQLQQFGIELKAGHSYKFSVKAASSADRKVELSLLDPEKGYYWYGGAVGEVTGSKFDLGEGGSSQTEREITSGRITTQGKHDFTYGRFETRAKVPYGKGYLPAFWLMATNESFYGQWPKCGEIDIMEVMGQTTNKSHHTIHYGYDSGSGHKQNQGTKTLSGTTFADDYHVFRVDWEPGLITWYVDDEKVYETSDWYTGEDETSQITYPAPFDQNFYIILNLAVGGSWVGYPDDSVYAAMNDQSFEVDYVRVYQKSQEEYEKMEAEAKRPTAEEKSYREADEIGNYVVNGDFSKAVAIEGALDDTEDNFKLHLENDGQGTEYVVDNGAITISPVAEGSQNYSVQLKQPNLPMYKGWEYELTFDAYAAEERDIVVDIEGPDRNWIRYLQDTSVSLTTEKKTYTLSFTMDEKSDPNGCLEFNLGKLGSTAAVTISNVRLTHKSGEAVEGVIKTVRADGNYVYNGSFDQGDKRLGYWEFSEENAQFITVDNASGKRELKVTVPEGKTVTIAQSKLSPMVRGRYEVRFGVRSEAGNGKVAVDVAGKTFSAGISTEMTTFSRKFDLTEDKDRDASYITLSFDQAGTYYIDDVFVGDAALIKNGSFNAGLAGFSPYVYDTVKASYGVDNTEGNDNAFVMTIQDTVADSAGNEWYVQLNQDGVTLEEGKTYKLSFKAKSSIERNISYCMQEFEGSWTNYSGTGAVAVGPEYQTFSQVFTMNHPTDTNTRFNITMGSVGGVRITEKHDIYIDDISLEEVTGEEPGTEPVEGPGEVPGEEPGDEPQEPVVEPEEPEVPQTPAAELVKKWGATYYVTEDGTKLTGFQTIDGETYYFAEKNGAMEKSSFIEVDGVRYYALKDGVIAKNQILSKWGTEYLFDADGKLLTGFNVFNGNTYYSKDKGGIVKASWIKLEDGTYYAKADGHVAISETITKWGKKYTFDENGRLVE